ncbi:MAG: winged helix DNA-binding domain-containing protein [Nitrososphaerota archaeon]|nr:winged helix DNA-binding domain-containing protein [Nitrososphaerota archaeon]
MACRRVRVDPLDVVGRVQDLIFASRVEGYRRDHLGLLLYRERAGFEFGGAVSIYPRDLLRLHWSWVQNEGLPKRWEAWYSKNKKLTLQVLQEIKKRGPLGSQEWPDGERVDDYRSGRAEGLALYVLWRRLEILVHHREGTRKLYELTEKMFGRLREPLSEESTLEEMACETLGLLGLSGPEGVRNLRTTEEGRGRSRLTKRQLRQRLVRDGRVVEVQVEGEKLTSVVRAEQVPLLEEVSAGGVPKAWRPFEPEPEATFLAPIDVTIANGRSQSLLGFEYLWEVYKPARKRRWGYYVLPVLLGDQLVGRIEPVLARDTKRLLIQRAWWEEGTDLQAVAKPFARGVMRFADFLQAKDVAFGDVGPSAFQASLKREAVRARN